MKSQNTTHGSSDPDSQHIPRGIHWLCALLFLGWSGSATWAAPFRVPDHDLRIALDVEPLVEGIERLHGAYYRAHFTKCGSGGHILVDVHRKPELKWTPTRDGIDSRVGGEVLFSTELHADVQGPHCHPSVGAACSISTCLGPLSRPDAIDLTGRCILTPLGSNGFVFPIPITLPAFLYDGVKIDLGQVGDPNGASWARLERGHFQGSAWSPELGDLVIPVLANSTLVDGARGPILVIDAILGERTRQLEYSDEAHAERAFASDMPLWKDSRLGVSLGLPFLASSSQGLPEDRSLFDYLLPLKLEGHESSTVGSRQDLIHYELYLTKANASIQTNKNGSMVTVSFSVSTPRIWRVLAGGKREEGTVDSAETNAVLSKPEFESQTGRLALLIHALSLKLAGHFGSEKVSLTPSNLASALNGARFDLGVVNPTFIANLPECIEAGGELAEAWHVCPDGQTTGRLSLETPEKRPQWTVRLDKIRARIADGAIQVSAPIDLNKKALEPSEPPEQWYPPRP